MKNLTKKLLKTVTPVALISSAVSASIFSSKQAGTNGIQPFAASPSPSPSTSPSPSPSATPTPRPSPSPTAPMSGSDLFGDTYGPFTIDGFRL
ncbi:MAG TPA: hypothetical protein VG733_19850 [Chthoniobacteraceae bacterium]|nr:hypothetical protein [Chthoniobacteraceae bacterium]